MVNSGLIVPAKGSGVGLEAEFSLPHDEHPDISIRFSLPEEVLTARENMVVYRAEGGEGRLLGTDHMANVYAYYRENKDASADIFVEEAVMSQRIDTVFTSLFALERSLI